MRDGGLAAAVSLEAARGPSLRPKTPQGSSSSCSSSVAGGAGGRLRAIRLVRRKGETYGFSLRGGKEHGTGFFVSHVEPGSEAFLQGLRAGDQVVRVNNLTVEQAVHREVTAMVQSKGSVLLHIKSTGIIPLKEHRGDPLTWLVVDDDEELSDQGTDSCGPSMEATPPPHPHSSHQTGYARIYLTCSSKVGLGCSICKGPPEKPGIFVQSVKVGGVARSAGLRPGDQVIACNDVSFAHLEFAEAVYVLKSSPRLVLDVLRGAGLDLVTGESSGYNSSASSVAGDQTPPSSSSSDPRDSDHSIASRLSAVSHHLTLDRSRNWQEIENEWAEAEAADKRRQLQASQKTLKTRAQRDASHRLGSIASRSLSSLSVALQEEEYEEQRTAFRDPRPSPIYPSSCFSPTHSSLKATLRSSRSTDDVSEDTSHKIALLTSADPHVNNIVVTGGPKDERDAVFRLDQLSSPSASRTSTLSSGTSQVTVRSSSGSGGCPSPMKAAPPHTPESLVEQQLQELRREQQRLQEEANRLAEERRRFEEEKRRGLERTQSAPLSPLVISCLGQSLTPSLQPPPSPTSSIASGRHTTRVLIKSPPPPPPPRRNTTALSNHHSPFHPHQVSPPASPAHSSSSSGVGSSCGSGAPPRRCKSIGSISASSGESTVWEDPPVTPQALPLTTSLMYHPSIPPPTLPKPPAPPSTPSSSANGPPPPPPPPPPPSTSLQLDLAAAINRELERRPAQDVQRIEAKLDQFKKDKSKSVAGDPKLAQHAKLMEEIKIKQKKMLSKDNMGDGMKKDETEKKEEDKTIKQQLNSSPRAPSPPPPSTVEFSSKIINNSKILNQNKEKGTSQVREATEPLNNGISSAIITTTTTTTATTTKSRVSIGGTTSKLPISKTTSIPVNKVTSSATKSTVFETQQWNERMRGSLGVSKGPSPVVPNKPRLRSTATAVTVMQEFRPEEKPSQASLKPPSAYFELEKKTSSGKPLVSISTYPSPNHRPTPLKMDFLPQSSSKIEVNGVSVVDSQSTNAILQNELKSTLTRSNLRQRSTAEQVFEGPLLPSTSTSTSTSTKPSFITTTIVNTATPPKASLSSKYSSIGQGTKEQL